MAGEGTRAIAWHKPGDMQTGGVLGSGAGCQAHPGLSVLLASAWLRVREPISRSREHDTTSEMDQRWTVAATGWIVLPSPSRTLPAADISSFPS